MEIVLLSLIWAHECMAIFFNIDEHRTWDGLTVAGI